MPRCSKCRNWIKQKDQDFADAQWMAHIQTEPLGHMVVNRVPLPKETREYLGTSESTVVTYCQDCLKEILMEYIFEQPKSELKVIIGGRR